ncbi:MAG: STAS domain-containing protein [Actinomycetota bacterium]
MPDDASRARIAEQGKGFTALWAVYEAEYDAVFDQLMQDVSDHQELAPLVKAITPEDLAVQREEGRERLRAAIEGGRWDDYFAHVKREGATYARAGLSFSAWTPLLFGFRIALTDRLISAYEGDHQKLREALAALNTLADVAFAVLGQAYLEEKERVIADQHTAIQELATPILSVRPGLLILPLIGVIDSRRAAQITEALLQAIVEHRARAVVIDVTGVPAVDSMVANHLIQTAEAGGLMGAEVFVSGVSTANALTLVRIGLDPRRLNTVGDLQSAIERAERILVGNLNGHAQAPDPEMAR